MDAALFSTPILPCYDLVRSTPFFSRFASCSRKPASFATSAKTAMRSAISGFIQSLDSPFPRRCTSRPRRASVMSVEQEGPQCSRTLHRHARLLRFVEESDYFQLLSYPCNDGHCDLMNPTVFQRNIKFEKRRRYRTYFSSSSPNVPLMYRPPPQHASRIRLDFARKSHQRLYFLTLAYIGTWVMTKCRSTTSLPLNLEWYGDFATQYSTYEIRSIRR